MPRTTTITAAGLLGLALLTPLTSASAAGETCRGEAATIVGTPDVSLKGTEGRDVIVSAGAHAVNALGGDDLVCVTGGTETYLTGDAGNDVVDATQPGPAKLVASLGDGDDTFVGAAPTLEVWGSSFFYADAGVDDMHVTALPGAVVRVESGAPLQPNSDRVRVDGSGNVRWQGLPTTSSVLAGGSQDSRLDAALPDGALTADLRVGSVVARQGGPNGELRWSGFDSFRFRAGEYTRDTVTSLDLTGTPGDDRVDLDLGDRAIRVRAGMGRGDDTLQTGIVGAPGSSYAGGGGRDLLGVAEYGNVELDLAAGRLWARVSRTAYPRHPVVPGRARLLPHRPRGR